MLIFYDPDPNDPTSGPVLYTFNGSKDLVAGQTNYIEVADDFDLGSTIGKRVESGQIVSDVLDPAYQEILRRKIDIERDRRMKAGFVFQSNQFDFDDASKARITGMATLAGFALGQGAQAGNYLWHGGADPFVWITSDNSFVPMDAPTCFAFGQAAATHEITYIFAARNLKDMVPVPETYENDAWWPA